MCGDACMCAHVHASKNSLPRQGFVLYKYVCYYLSNPTSQNRSVWLVLVLLLMQAVDDCRASLQRALCMARAGTPGRTAWSTRLVGSLSNFTYALFTAYIFWLMCFAFCFEE